MTNPLLQSLQSSREKWIEQKMKDPWMSGFYEGWVMREHKEEAMRTVLKEALDEGPQCLLKAVVAMVAKEHYEHQHSIYTHCRACHTWGVNMPGDKVCGNCGNTEDTTTYYPDVNPNKILDTIISELNSAIEEI